MPGFAMPCLNTSQPIFGSDIHLCIPPPPPAPPTPLPHPVVWVVGLSQETNFLMLGGRTGKALLRADDIKQPVMAGWGHAVAQGHDSGPHPSHVFVNALMPQIVIGSSSKAEFASGTVHTKKGLLAVGALWAVNPQLQCGVVPLPSGSAITVANTVRAGFTLGDFIEGLKQMIFDSVVTWLIGLTLGALTRGGLNLIPKLASMLALDAVAKWLVGGMVHGDKVALALQYPGRTSTRWNTWKILTPNWVRDFKDPINDFERVHMQYLKSPKALEDFLLTGFGFKFGGPMGASAKPSCWGGLTGEDHESICSLFHD